MKTPILTIEGAATPPPPIRPAPAANRKTALVKSGLKALQYVSPEKTATVIWHYFTKPGRPKFTPAQEELIGRAVITRTEYRSLRVTHYHWGPKDAPKILLSHGWRSKTADFRRMIEGLLEAGFSVEGIDMKAHGMSEGKHTALPEFRDVLKEHYVKNGPFHGVVGYSLGGLAAGIVLSEISPAMQPAHLFVIASPPYARYFFKDTVENLGFRTEVYEAMCRLVEKHYRQNVDYFDMRNKMAHLEKVKLHLIYDRHDDTVPFQQGEELLDHYPEAHFVETRGLGHLKVIAHNEVISYISSQLITKE